MRVRRRLVLPLVAACAAVAVSCGPNDQAQTVTFYLDARSERLNEIEFVVSYASGKFASTDGQCTVSSAAGPRSFEISEARMMEKDAVRMMSRQERRARAASIRVALGGSTTTHTTQTTEEPATTTTLASQTTTTLASNGTCGDKVVEGSEKCDDGNVVSGDGCDANCQAEFSFSSIDDDEGELTIRITNGLGLRPGSLLAFCKFQGDVEDAEIGITTLTCGLSNGNTCNPASNAIVGLSTTTTTTTTTTSTTSTTVGDGATSTTSSTMQ